MAAYRQAKRMQRGTLTAQGGFSTNDPALLQVPCTIQCVFVPKEINVKQTILSTSGGANTPRLDIYSSGNIYIACAGANRLIQAQEGSLYNITFVVMSDEQYAYTNGELLFSNPFSLTQLGNYVIGSLFNFNDRLKGVLYLLHRHFNYAMSADEVKALDNNNDPMGYIVPSNYKILGDTYLSDFSEGADGWYVTPLTDYVTITVSDGAVVVSKDSANQNMIIGRLHSPYNVQISNYSVQLKFSEPLPSQVISIDVRPFNSIHGVTLNISPDRLTASGIFINSTSKPNGGSLIIFRATGPVSISISSISFTPSICLAEYLPQNLMYSKDDKTIATSWLDSAKQMPLSDEYMEPLFQSIGGYDMAANGAPEILYNE